MEQVTLQVKPNTNRDWSEDPDQPGYFAYSCWCGAVEVRYFAAEDGGGVSAWNAGLESCAKCGLGMIRVDKIPKRQYDVLRVTGSAVRSDAHVD